MGYQKQQSGFSLVELSIVLVILGLLTGGILAGQSLIRAAEMRSVNSEYSRYTASVHTFRDKYFGLPGDLRNATKFWGDQTGGTAEGMVAACANLTTGATDQRTCNGDGDGHISPELGGMDRSHWYEAYRAWQHLANAGLIEGSYNGVSGLGPTQWVHQAGINVPRSRIGTGMWTLRYIDPGWFIASTWFSNPYGNILVIGAPGAAADGSGPLLKPEEAWNLDTKFDDGKPGQGAVVSYMSALNPGCVVSNTPTTEYNLTGSAVACSLNIRLGI